MKKTTTGRGEPVASRRGVLAGFGGALAAGAGGARAASAPAQVADAPASDKTQERQPFYGRRQAGIVTPRPAAGMIVAFDVLAMTPPEVEVLFRTLTSRIAFLTKGGVPPEADPKFPPSDSGILGPIVTPDNLTMTVSLGASFFLGRDWLAPRKPALLSAMTKFANDALDPAICHGDLVLQICANSTDATIHALRDILKNTPDLMVLRWKQEGSVPVQQPRPDGVHESARNFLGFRDGTANPDSREEALMDKILWVGDGQGDSDWTNGGSYQVVRIVRNFVERWDRTPLGEQERIIGRRKATGAPFNGRVETDLPSYADDPEGKKTRLDAHIRLANPRTEEARANLILRRPFNYSNGVTKSGQLDQGLLFIAYQADLEKGFIFVQKRLDGEPLEEYIKPVGGGYFFALPGCVNETDFLGRSLLAAAGHVATGFKP